MLIVAILLGSISYLVIGVFTAFVSQQDDNAEGAAVVFLWPLYLIFIVIKGSKDMYKNIFKE